MKSLKGLQKLHSLAKMVLDQELAALAQTSKQKKALEHRISLLELALNRHLSMQSGVVEQTHLTQSMNDANWQRWRLVEKKKINLELALVEAEREKRLLVARTAFGRTQALHLLTVNVKRSRGEKT